MKKLLKKILFYDKWYESFKNSVFYVWYKMAQGVFAKLLYGNPSKDFFIIGVTGTNGKTTTVNILHKILNDTFAKTAMISTANIKIGDKTLANDSKMSSLDVFELHSMLALSKAEGCKVAILEVTSIGLEQHRFYGVDFDVAVLTNITEDHLDYHKTMENYSNAKKKLFKYVLKNKKAEKYGVFPKDDIYGRQRFDEMPFDKKINYGIYSSAMMRAENVKEYKDKTVSNINYLGNIYHMETKLLGAFNVQNILAALSVCVQMGINLNDAIKSVAGFEGVVGRLQELKHNDVAYYVDFAHSPDALEKTLTYLKNIAESRVIVMFGAPGNRDKLKRPKMGAVVDRFADLIVVTDDDPDTENRDDIIQQIAGGIKREKGDSFEIVPDRENAIKYVAENSKPGDIVLLAGKGHENVQWTNKGHRPWNDMVVLKQTLNI